MKTLPGRAVPAILLVVCFAFVTACGGSSPPDPESSQIAVTIYATQAPAPAAPAAPTAPPESTDPAQAPTGLSRNSPLPSGAEVKFEDWAITVTQVARGDDAAAAVSGANSFNPPPRVGHEYVLVTIALQNISANRKVQAAQRAVDLRLTGIRNILYERAPLVLPQPIKGDVSPGASVAGQACFEVPRGESLLMLRAQESSSFDTRDQRFVALDPGARIAPEGSLGFAGLVDMGKQRDAPAGAGDIAATGGWQIRLMEAARGDQAARLVAQADPLNRPAPDGMEYVVVRMQARHIDLRAPDTSRKIDPSSFTLIGAADAAYQPLADLAPAPLLEANLFPGGEVDGWLAFAAAADEDLLTLVFKPPFSFEADAARYFMIH